ncbi:ArsR family transcriptional regulator [Kribbella sp. DT2]|uniref:ArsR/SmtB family transcription factor n=1 Tax=Kribbella sp. DT2 TaxID=3393427 RepID=UPI003CFB8A95
MISFTLGVEDLADTRFAVSPSQETVFSVWVLRDPGRYPLHLPWRRSVLRRISPADHRLLLALVGDSRALPDFLTPRPTTFFRTFEEELAGVRETPARIVRRDLLATHAPGRLPDVLAEIDDAERLLELICDLLQRYWDTILLPLWSRLKLVLEADITYRARQLATGGARALFADLHPNVRWDDGVLRIEKMIGQHHVGAGGRGLLLAPSVFAYKPVPPMDPSEAPMLAYPARGLATLWSTEPTTDATALAALIGAPRATLLGLLSEGPPTSELARRLKVTPSAVSQHLKVLHASGLVTRTRDGRQVLYRRSGLGDQLTG